MRCATAWLGLCLMAVGGAAAADGVGWRGDGSGVYRDATPPVEWGPEQNIRWSTELPAWGNAAPVLVGERIFIGAEPTDVICVNARDGSIQWQATQTYFDGLTPEEIEQAKEMQRQAAEARQEISVLDQERKKAQGELNAINGLRGRIAELQKKADLQEDVEKVVARIEELEGEIQQNAQALEKAPNNGGLKKKAAQLAEDLKLLREPDVLKQETEKVKADLAPREAKEAELKQRADELKKQADSIRRDRLAALERYDRPPTHGVNGYSSQTAVSDGQDVFVLRGNGMVACYALDGTRKWLRFVQKSSHGWGQCTSPVLAGDSVVVQLKYLVALDRQTGETRWERPEAAVAFGTPACAQVGGEDVIITANGDIIRAADGRMLARRVSKLDYASPIVSDGVVYFIERGGKAIKLPEAIGDEFKPEVLWTASGIEGDRYYASPVLVDGLIYAVNQRSQFTCIDAKTGEPVYSQKLDLGATVYPSVAYAGGHLYVSAENGVTAVVKPGRTFEELARNKLEAFRASPVFVGDRMYIRGMKRLYCIAVGTP